MPNTFLIGDTHFCHSNIIKFEPVYRPFATIEEHDEKLIENWNSVVKPADIVWHLGDFAFGTQESKIANICRRLNGDKRLILGNHDNLSKIDYTKFFTKIFGVHYLHGKYLLSHIPVVKTQSSRFNRNIHGHMHSKKIDDDWYVNVSVEQIKLTPIEISEIK